MTVACRLPDGRQVMIAPDCRDRLSCGVIVLHDVLPGGGGGLQPALDDLALRLQQEHADREPSRIAGLTEARNLYKSFGMDPSRHRPSSEALLRRVLKGRGLYRISNFVDACNLASLTYLLPIGLYDLERVEGDITLRAGSVGEEYPGIRKGPVHLAGRLGLFDGAGPFGSPTSDSARTCTGESTRHILAVVMATASYPAAAMALHLGHFAEVFATHCGARMVHHSVLNGGGA